MKFCRAALHTFRASGKVPLGRVFPEIRVPIRWRSEWEDSYFSSSIAPFTLGLPFRRLWSSVTVAQRGDNNDPLPSPRRSYKENSLLAQLTDFGVGLPNGSCRRLKFSCTRGTDTMSLLGYRSRGDLTSTRTPQHVVTLIHFCE